MNGNGNDQFRFRPNTAAKKSRTTRFVESAVMASALARDRCLSNTSACHPGLGAVNKLY